MCACWVVTLSWWSCIAMFRMRHMHHNKMCLCNTNALSRNKVQISYFYNKGHGQGQTSLTLVSFNGWFHELSMHTKYEVSISFGSKVTAKVSYFCHKTDRQGKS